ncbi:MAG: hypothetical protein PH343_02680, partial [Nitrospira sp.]|nr:hypothetical protein [Nitrospira sp.]
ENRHAYTPGEEINEQPLLINPLSEDPEQHLTIDVKTGIMGYKSQRGKACIDIFGLNDRYGLREGRITAYRSAQAILIRLIMSDERESVRELCDIMNGKTAYAFAGRKAIKDKSFIWENLSKYCMQDNPA